MQDVADLGPIAGPSGTSFVERDATQPPQLPCMLCSTKPPRAHCGSAPPQGFALVPCTAWAMHRRYAPLCTTRCYGGTAMHRYAYAMHTLCTRYAHAMRRRYAPLCTAMHTLCTRYAHAMHTLCNRGQMILRHLVVAHAMHTLCTRYAPPLCTAMHDALLWGFRYAPLCTAMRRRYAPLHRYAPPLCTAMHDTAMHDALLWGYRYAPHHTRLVSPQSPYTIQYA